MLLSKARELREERMKLVKSAHALLEAEKNITGETRSKFDQMMKDADGMKADIDRFEMVEAAIEDRGAAPPNGRPGGASDPAREKEERHRKLFRSYLINGMGGMDFEDRMALQKEYRDLGTGGGNALQGTGAGYFVPVGFVNDVEQAMKYFGPMLDVATVMPTASGQPMPYPTDNDTSNSGEQIGENVQVTAQDVTISAVQFGAYKFSTKMIKVSLELLQDSAFDIESYLKEKFAVRLGRIVNTKTTIGAGSGSGTINGIITAAAAGPMAVGSSTNDGGSGTAANSIGSDDLIELEHSIDIMYRRDAKYMMHDSTLKFLKKLKDKYGRPLWLPGLAVREPDTINGYGYAVNNDMDTIATTKKTVAFGNLKKYVIRQVKELSVMRLDERYADFGQVAFIGFARYDGNLVDAGTNPVKYLVQG